MIAETAEKESRKLIGWMKLKMIRNKLGHYGALEPPAETV